MMAQQQVESQRYDDRQTECSLKSIEYLSAFLRGKTGLHKIQSQSNKQRLKKLRDKLINDGFTSGQLFKFIKQLGFQGLMGKHYLIYEVLKSKYQQFGQNLHKEGYIQKIIDDFGCSDDLKVCYASIRSVIKIYFENPNGYQNKLISAYKQDIHAMEEYQWKELIMQLDQHFKHDDYSIFDKFKQQKLIEVFSRRQSQEKQPSIASTQGLTKTPKQKSTKQSKSQPSKANDKSNDQSQKEEKQQPKLGAITFKNNDNNGLAQQVIQTGENAINHTEHVKQKNVISVYVNHVYEGDKQEVIEVNGKQQQRDNHSNESGRNQNNHKVQSDFHQESQSNLSDHIGNHGLEARYERGNQWIDNSDSGENQQYDDDESDE